MRARGALVAILFAGVALPFNTPFALLALVPIYLARSRTMTIAGTVGVGVAMAVHDLIWASILGSAPQVNAALALVEEDFSGSIPALSIPIWLIWGAADPIASLRTGQALVNRLPQAQLLIMPNVGHTPMDAPTVSAFLPLLERALQQAPQPTFTDAQPNVKALDLRCNSETNRFITGSFRESSSTVVRACTWSMSPLST